MSVNTNWCQLRRVEFSVIICGVGIAAASCGGGGDAALSSAPVASSPDPTSATTVLATPSSIESPTTESPTTSLLTTTTTTTTPATTSTTVPPVVQIELPESFSRTSASGREGFGEVELVRAGDELFLVGDRRSDRSEFERVTASTKDLETWNESTEMRPPVEYPREQVMTSDGTNVVRRNGDGTFDTRAAGEIEWRSLSIRPARAAEFNGSYWVFTRTRDSLTTSVDLQTFVDSTQIGDAAAECPLPDGRLLALYYSDPINTDTTWTLSDPERTTSSPVDLPNYYTSCTTGAEGVLLGYGNDPTDLFTTDLVDYVPVEGLTTALIDERVVGEMTVGTNASRLWISADGRSWNTAELPTTARILDFEEFDGAIIVAVGSPQVIALYKVTL